MTRNWIDTEGIYGWDDAAGWDTGLPQQGDDVLISGGEFTDMVSGPSDPITLHYLDVADNVNSLPPLTNVTIENGTIHMGSCVFDGAYSGITSGLFENAGVNANPIGILLSATFTGNAVNSGIVATATFYSASQNFGTLTTGIFYEHSANKGGVDNLFLHDAATNSGGSCDTIFINGVLDANSLISGFGHERMGIFNIVSLSGVPAQSTGGGGGPLGGPEISV